MTLVCRTWRIPAEGTPPAPAAAESRLGWGGDAPASASTWPVAPAASASGGGGAAAPGAVRGRRASSSPAAASRPS